MLLLRPQGSGCRLPMTLLNTSNITGRFRVKQPPTPYIRVIYAPRPVAAGMKIKLEVELRAQLLGEVTETIAIHTEDDIFELRLSASVLDERSFAQSSRQAAGRLLPVADALAFRADGPNSFADRDAGPSGVADEYYQDDGAEE